MKKFLLFLSFLLATASTYAAETLYMTLTDGSVVSFQLSLKPTITFSGSVLTVTTSDKATQQFTLADVARYSFTASSRIDAATADKGIQVFDDKIVVEGNNAKVSVVSINGTVVDAQIERSGSTTVVSTQSLPAGLYIIKANNHSLKVLKK